MRLLTVSLIISLLGIFILLGISSQISEKEITGRVVSESDIVKTEGTIISSRTIDNFSILILDNNQTIVCFDCKFNQGEKIRVTGIVSEYNGELQINAEEIELI